ncbi:hypothetical protein OUZ56_019909 [Daphnia magna]|uniref:Uncharacterized protein n=1 Tax=Daphnia magna TaxID=35525 RepID=A0ABQ9ZCZ6_9CRUS|nr:hypothetical protein OUZ56_019909 [Daphnia magna]
MRSAQNGVLNIVNNLVKCVKNIPKEGKWRKRTTNGNDFIFRQPVTFKRLGCSIFLDFQNKQLKKKNEKLLVNILEKQKKRESCVIVFCFSQKIYDFNTFRAVGLVLMMFHSHTISRFFFVLFF